MYICSVHVEYVYIIFCKTNSGKMYEYWNQQKNLIVGFCILTFFAGLVAYSLHQKVVYRCDVTDLPWTPLCTKTVKNETECKYAYNTDSNKCENTTSVNPRGRWKCERGWEGICTHDATPEMDPEAFCIAHFGKDSYSDVTKRCEVSSIKVSKEEL